VNSSHSDLPPDLLDLFAESEPSAPLRPMWPHVQARLRGDRPSPRRSWSWSWAVGSGALATAGFAIGLLFGAGNPGAGNPPASSAVEESFWGDLGSSFAEGSPFALYSLYERLESEEGS